MRTFYIFNVNEYFYSMYKDTPYRIYEMLEDIYYVRNYDIKISSKLYFQMVNRINKLMMNEYLNTNYISCTDYTNEANTHLIATNYEYSKLIVGNTYLKIKSNRNYPLFFDSLNKYNNSIFVCDFQNKDYFWLDKVSCTI